MSPMPVTKVVVMEDRAQVERTGAVTLSGVTRLEVPGLPLVAVDRSLKVECQGGKVVDAKLERRWKEQPKGGLPADASALRSRVHELEQLRLAQADEAARLLARNTVVSSARSDLLRSIAEFTGVGQADVDAWRAQLAKLTEAAAKLDEGMRAAKTELSRTDRLLAEARASIAVAEEPDRKLECTLVMTVEGQGEAQLRASYLVPCAVWRPAYRATLGADAVQVEAEAVVWQRTGEDWTQVELLFSTARPTLGTNPPQLSEDRLSTRPRQEAEKRVVDVQIREEAIQSSGEKGGAPEMPGLDDGGEARLLRASGPTTVRSDGQPHRVALFSFEAKATVELVCPTELTSLVFVMARFPNSSGQVLLAGPVDLIRQSGLVGRAGLKFTAPGETVKLSFGNEDGLQVVRETDETVDTARLTGRRTTTRKVKLHVSNARPLPAKLVLEERVPVSEVKEVEIQVLQKDCSPAPSTVTKEGIARMEISLGANATHTARFAWELSAASKVAGV